MLEIGTSGLMSGEGKRASVLRLYRASPRLYKCLKTKEHVKTSDRFPERIPGPTRCPCHAN